MCLAVIAHKLRAIVASLSFIPPLVESPIRVCPIRSVVTLKSSHTYLSSKAASSFSACRYTPVVFEHSTILSQHCSLAIVLCHLHQASSEAKFFVHLFSSLLIVKCEIVQSQTLYSSLYLDGGQHQPSPSILHSRVLSTLLYQQLFSTPSLSSDVFPFFGRISQIWFGLICVLIVSLTEISHLLEKKKSQRKRALSSSNSSLTESPILGLLKFQNLMWIYPMLDSLLIASFIDEQSHQESSILPLSSQNKNARE